MFGTQDLMLFIVSGLLLNIAPGPDSLLVMKHAASQGWRAGSAAAMGIGAGTCVHILAAAAGLSAILATSSTAFALVKYAGAAYLLYLGLSMLIKKIPAKEVVTAQERSTDHLPQAALSGLSDVNLLAPPRLTLANIFRQGLLTNVLNPKVAVFFVAFVPQFIAADASNKALAFIILGGIFNLNGMLWCHVLAVSSALASQRVKINQTLTGWLNRLIGFLFVTFGIKLAFFD